MKTNYTFITTLAIMLLSAMQITSYAQQAAAPPHRDFVYDAAGNRVLRYIIAQRLRNESETKDEVAEQIAEQHGILVYPNPVQEDNVNVSLSSLKRDDISSTETQEKTIYVLDNSGKVVLSQKTSSSITQINLSAYSAGIYYVKVMAGKEELFYKITKTK